MMRIRRALRAGLATALERAQSMRRQLINLALFGLIAVGGGLWGTWLMVERGSALTTDRQGPWTLWVAAGRSDADPYTRAHFVRRAVLPTSGALVQRYEATVDSTGEALHSSCEYVVEGPEPPGFWSIAVFDRRGRMIRNDAHRHSYNSDTALAARSGRLEIHLARNARPGNWLPTGGAGRMTVILQIERGLEAGTLAAEAAALPLPALRRVRC